MSIVRFIFNVLILSVIICWKCVVGWSYSFTESGQPSKFMEFQTFLFTDSYLALEVTCGEEIQTIEVAWHLIQFQCLQTSFEVPLHNVGQAIGLKCSQFDGKDLKIIIAQSSSTFFQCFPNKKLSLKDLTGENVQEIKFLNNGSCEQRTINMTSNYPEKISDRVASGWGLGTYNFYLIVRPTFSNSNSLFASGTLNVMGKHGHLDQFIYWKYIICCLMSILYLLLSSLWLGIWAYSKEYTSRIHVALGMVCVLACFSNVISSIELSIFNSIGRKSHFTFILGSILFTCYNLFVKIIFTAAATGLRIIRPSLSSRQWTTIISLSASIMLLQVIQMLFSRGRNGGSSDESILRLVTPFKIQNYMFIMETFLDHVLSCIALYFCSTTFVYLYLRRHSSRGKFLAFSFFASSTVAIFVVSLVSMVAMIADKFSTCINSELSTSDWFTADLFPQIKLFISLVATMFLWRPVDEFRSYGFQALSSQEEACVQFINNGSPDDDVQIINKFPTETDNY